MLIRLRGAIYQVECGILHRRAEKLRYAGMKPVADECDAVKNNPD
ncbi:hypothetical protein [Dickeya zeae]|nr:hypothetical protein [Dickeya zeae]